MTVAQKKCSRNSAPKRVKIAGLKTGTFWQIQN